MRDWRGNPVSVGSVIVYPQRHSSHMWMVEARVEEITEKDQRDRIVPALKVKPINATWTHRIAERTVTLTSLDRVTVVVPRPEDQPLKDVKCKVCHQLHQPLWVPCLELTG